MEPQRRYRVAAIQFASRIGDKQANIDDLDRMIREAAQAGAQLIVTPEVGTVSTFWLDRDEVAPYVETVPGPTVDHYVALAGELDILIMVGLAEVDAETGIFYNTSVLVGPVGLIGHHRKVHGYMSEPLWAAEGDLGFSVHDTPLGRLGLMICMDANYPESSRLLALQGAEVLLVPSNWTAEVCPAPLWITRAFENHAWLICSTRSGTDRGFIFSGGSCVLEPDGAIQSLVDDGDGIAYGTVDLDDPRMRSVSWDSSLDLVADRRPEVYETLALHRYQWSHLETTRLMGGSGLPVVDRTETAVIEVGPAPLAPGAMVVAIDEAVGAGAQLVVIPDGATSGPVMTRQEADAAAAMAHSVLGTVEAACARNGAHVVLGVVERDGGRLFPTTVLVGPGGIVSRYRAVHLSGPQRAWATPGDRLLWADTSIGRIGLCSGTDLLFPEVVRCLALEGADIVCAAGAMAGPRSIPRAASRVAIPPDHRPMGDDPDHWRLARVRAGENNVYVALANWRGDIAGTAYVGGSGIFGPVTLRYPWDESVVEGPSDGPFDIVHGTLLLRVVSEEWPDNPVRAKPVLARRLPVLYGPLLRRSHSVGSSGASDLGALADTAVATAR